MLGFTAVGMRSRLLSIAVLAAPLIAGCTSHRSIFDEDGGTPVDGGVDGGSDAGTDGGSGNDAGTPDGGVTGAMSIRITGLPMMGLQVGATAALHVVALGAGGMQTDVTAQATLSSANPAVASLSGDTLTAVARGMDVVTASLPVQGGMPLQASAQVQVIDAAGGMTTAVQVAPATLSLAPTLGSQLSANATQGDGTQRSVTTQATWTSSDETLCTVDNVNQKGYVTAVAVGDCTVTAAFNGKQGTAAISIKSLTVTALVVAPATATIPAGGSQQLTATVTLSDGSVADATHTAVWSTSDSSKATVQVGLVGAAAPGMATITATVGSLTATAAITVSAATLQSISVAPPSTNLAAGLSQQLIATAVYSDGTTGNITASATWTSSAPAIAALESGTPGRVDALTAGRATITATSGSVSGTASVLVTSAVPTKLTLIPSPVTLPVGVSQQMVARAVFSDNSVRNVATDATWSVGNPSLATVNSSGLVLGTATGQTQITAMLSGVSASADLTVTAATLTQILLLPQNSSIPVGGTQKLTATGIYGDNSLHDVTEQATWTSSSPGNADVSNSAGTRGLVTGGAAGATQITATVGAVTSSPAAVTITAAALISIQIGPRQLLTAVYITVPTRVTATYADGSQQDVTTQAVFSSSAPGTASVIAAGADAGQVTGVAQGQASITATLGGQSASVNITVVAAMLQSITINQPRNAIEVGQTEQLTAMAQFQGAPVGIDVTTLVTWTSSDSTVGTFLANPNGLFTAQGAGMTTVAAELDGVSGTRAITVSPTIPVSITVQQTVFTLPVGVTRALIATGTYADGSTVDLTYGAAWSSDANRTAVVGNTGLTKGYVTGVSAGTAHITATLDGISGSATATVDASNPTSLLVTPIDQTVTQTGGGGGPGGGGGGFRPTAGYPFYATAHFEDGTNQDVTQSCVWTSSDASVATISDTAGTRGQADIIATGLTNITATFRGLSDTTSLTSR